MPRSASRTVLRVAVLEGIANAYTTHSKMSLKRFKSAPEYFVTGRVQKSLNMAATGCSVELEPRVKGVMADANATDIKLMPKAQRTALRRALRLNGNFDIVVRWKNKRWNNRFAPRAPIEIKHPVQKAHVPSVVRDVERICAALALGRKSRHLDWGCVGFACYSGIDSREHVDDALKENIDAVVGSLEKALASAKLFGCIAKIRQGRLIKEARTNGIRYYKPCCITIKPDRSH